MKNLLKNKQVVGGLIVVLVLALGYYIWTSQSSTPLLTDSSAQVSPGSQEILQTLGQLHTIKLDPALFTDPVFVSLSDFGVTIPPQNAGRRNPFAPVGSTGAAATQPAKGAGQ